LEGRLCLLSPAPAPAAAVCSLAAGLLCKLQAVSCSGLGRRWLCLLVGAALCRFLVAMQRALSVKGAMSTCLPAATYRWQVATASLALADLFLWKVAFLAEAWEGRSLWRQVRAVVLVSRALLEALKYPRAMPSRAVRAVLSW